MYKQKKSKFLRNKLQMVLPYDCRSLSRGSIPPYSFIIKFLLINYYKNKEKIT